MTEFVGWAFSVVGMCLLAGWVLWLFARKLGRDIDDKSQDWDKHVREAAAARGWSEPQGYCLYGVPPPSPVPAGAIEPDTPWPRHDRRGEQAVFTPDGAIMGTPKSRVDQMISPPPTLDEVGAVLNAFGTNSHMPLMRRLDALVRIEGRVNTIKRALLKELDRDRT